MANIFDYLDTQKQTAEAAPLERKPQRQSNLFDYLDAAPAKREPTQTDRALGSTFELETTTEPVSKVSAIPELPSKPLNKTNFEELTKPENLKIIKDYAIARFGDTGKQKEGESDQDYVKRWMTSMRQVQWNTTLNAVPELNWIYNAKDEDVVKASKAHQLYDTIPDWYETGGQPGVRPFAEAALSAISEPTNIISFGIGAAARYKAARAAIDAGLKSRLKVVGAGAAAESVLGAAEDITQQQLRVETGLQKEINYEQTALAASISSVFGGIEAASAFRKPKISTKEDLENVLSGRKSALTVEDPATKKLAEDFDKELQDTLSKFDIFEGRKVLDELSPPGPLTQAEIRTDINRKAIDVAKYVMLLDPTFRLKQGQIQELQPQSRN